LFKDPIIPLTIVTVVLWLAVIGWKVWRREQADRLERTGEGRAAYGPRGGLDRPRGRSGSRRLDDDPDWDDDRRWDSRARRRDNDRDRDDRDRDDRDRNDRDRDEPRDRAGRYRDDRDRDLDDRDLDLDLDDRDLDDRDRDDRDPDDRDRRYEAGRRRRPVVGPDEHREEPDHAEVSINPGKCMRFAFCEHEAPEIFRLVGDRIDYKPWVPADQVRAAVMAGKICPARAIKVKVPGTKPYLPQPPVDDEERRPIRR
jgi:ferredoxin